ncbi:hypothetical protein [Chryseobacterium sp. MMS23-Vi53]|uniref:hypothetical protein n=1 Tax=Chryseobacterium sp. MMS23-Vi53 TaxID=3386644 RepID=UPI0039E7B8F6
METIKNETMNKKEIDLNISYKFINDNFILYINITNFSNKEKRFYFLNNTGGLARNGINLFNVMHEKLIAYEKTFISPVYNEEEINADVLLPNENKQFELSASVLKENNNLILFFKGISFKITKGEKFYITFDFLDTTSNMLEVVI